MRQILLLFLWCVCCLGLQAQGDNVVIDGVIFSADGKTLIKYTTEKTDESYTVPNGIEIIGENAFDSEYLKSVTLPCSLREIKRFGLAASNLVFITWQTYPDMLGDYIFGSRNSNVKAFYSSDNSTNCIALDGVLYSKDRKTLLRFPGGRADCYWIDYEVPEGVEIIGVSAFEGGKIEKITLPTSLRRIENNAFEMTLRFPTRQDGYMCVSEVVCNAVTPPTIVGNPFVTPHKISLKVPEGSSKNYWNTPYWNRFGTINGESRPASIDLRAASSGLKLTRENGLLNLKSERKIIEVVIHNTSGVCVWHKYVNSNDYQLETTYLPAGMLLLEIVYETLERKTCKLIN